MTSAAVSSSVDPVNGAGPTTGSEPTRTDAQEITAVLGGPHLAVYAATRTRMRCVFAAIDGAGYRLVRSDGTRWTIHQGPARLLTSELVEVAGALERDSGVGPLPAGRSPDPAEHPVLGAGELLALAEVVRGGDPDRLSAACAELDLPGTPWWVTELAWGAEGTLTMIRGDGERAQQATMLHLLTVGWGCLNATPDGDLRFRRLAPMQVQARIGALVADLAAAGDG